MKELFYKKGNKSAETAMMENAVTGYFKNKYGIEMIAEEQLPNNKRPDLYGICYSDGSEAERIIVEIKRDTSDFFSGYGLNFCVDCNYLAVPSRYVGFAIEFLRESYGMDGWNQIGVLEVTDTGFVRTVLYPSHRNAEFSVIKDKTGFVTQCTHLCRRERDY